MKRKNLIWMVPAGIAGIVIFSALGGLVVMLLWNWLAPELFGFRAINFWQALGLLALCRILFGGFGLSGGSSGRSRRRMEGRMSERIRARMDERWEQMTPEERERLRHGFNDRSGRTTPLDSNQRA